MLYARKNFNFQYVGIMKIQIWLTLGFILGGFIEKLQELKKALNDKNGDKLYQIFNSTKELRKEIIKAGQDTSKPDFGRKKN